MSSNLLSGYAVTAVILQQLLTADMIVFRPWTNCPWIVRSGDNLSVETTMETTNIQAHKNHHLPKGYNIVWLEKGGYCMATDGTNLYL